jgi:hypothetical protein
MEIYFKIGTPTKIIFDENFYDLEEAKTIAKEALCQDTPICCIYKCYFNSDDYSDEPYKKTEVERLVWGVDDQKSNLRNLDAYKWNTFDEDILDKKINNVESNIYWPEDDI